MSLREMLGALRSMARERPAFLLSELKIPPGENREIQELRRVLEPHLGTLALRAEEQGDDLFISRIPPANPFSPSRDGMRAFEGFLGHPSIPRRLQELIESYITTKTGKNWDDPVVLDRIRAAIRAQKGEYWDQAGGKPISYRAGYRVLAYLAYQVPVSLIQFGHILQGMAADGLLKDRMRILDIGSGPGTSSLAIIDAWSRLSPGEVEIFSLEQETENLEAYRFLVPAFASGARSVRIHEPLQADARAIDPDSLPREMDIIVFQNVLNELRDLPAGGKAAIVEKVSGALAGDGTVVIMEPADLENSVSLRKLTVELTGRGMTLYAPCTGIWNTACRPDRCWTFREGPPVTPPRLMSLLSASGDGYRYLNTDIKFSYSLIRKDRRTREAYRVPGSMKAIRLSKLQGHLGRRVNVVVAKMSGDLGGGRRDHVFKVCDGTPQKPVFVMVPEHHAANARAILGGGYGGILSLENVLVRFNPAHDAFNLFADRSTRVQAVGGREKGRKSPRGTASTHRAGRKDEGQGPRER